MPSAFPVGSAEIHGAAGYAERPAWRASYYACQQNDDGAIVTLADWRMSHKVVHIGAQLMTPMEDNDSLLQQLRDDLAGRRRTTATIRAKIIEALGDKLCGSGTGPAGDDLAAFATAQQQEKMSAARLRAYFGNLADRVIRRVRDRSS